MKKTNYKTFFNKKLYIYILGTQNWWWLVISILAKALRGGGSPLTCKMRVAETTIKSLEPPLFGLEMGSAIPKRPKEKQLGELARTTPRPTDLGWSNPP
jgi:hypothetical protein